MRRTLYLITLLVGVATLLGVGIAAAVGGEPEAASPVVPSSRADLSADPNGPATRAVATASRQLTACFLRNGAQRTPNGDESGFRLEGISSRARASCAAQDAALAAAYADPRYKLEQDALLLVMNYAWRCTAARGFSVGGFSAPAGSDAYASPQAGIESALAACKAEAASALEVSLPE